MKRIFSVKLDKALWAICADLLAGISWKLFHISNWNIAPVHPLWTMYAPAYQLQVQFAYCH